MDSRSAGVCVLLVLLLLGSPVSAERCETKRTWLYLCIKSTCEKPCEKLANEAQTTKWYSSCDGSFNGVCSCKICYPN
ncbi:hypothetical protein BRADI_1g72905v3 [Brachypodium distachyon]|uniref:Knottin scorpion toxin-like domain-containing protein n=1 Tax=Brachypodium distachyon TaxID=15368 RepID=A0A2K2DUU9_BRADI|nr:hypothetical protein BRADI_1g72905v3 [Brachypodium distachyon]